GGFSLQGNTEESLRLDSFHRDLRELDSDKSNGVIWGQNPPATVAPNDALTSWHDSSKSGANDFGAATCTVNNGTLAMNQIVLPSQQHIDENLIAQEPVPGLATTTDEFGLKQEATDLALLDYKKADQSTVPFYGEGKMDSESSRKTQLAYDV